MYRKIYDNQKGAKEEWAKMKDASFVQKIEYLVEYYGLFALAVLVVVLILAFGIPSCVANNRPEVISGEFVYHGPSEEGGAALKEYLCEALGMDPKKTNISLTNRGMDSEDAELMADLYEVFSARVMAKDVDFFCADESTLNVFMSKESYDYCCFGSLYDFLPEDMVNELDRQGRLTYITLNDGTTFPYTIDPTGTKLAEMLEIMESDGVLAIVINTENTEAVAAMCKLLLE